MALLSDLTSGRSITNPAVVVGHSMGARLTMEALRQLRLTGRGDVLDRLDVVLAAPDIDIDLFLDQVAATGRLRHPIAVLVSTDDQALKISARLAARRPRLGQVDVHDPVVQELALTGSIRIVDITHLPSDDPAHGRYVALASRQPEMASRNPFDDLLQAGAFIFDQVGDMFHRIGTVLVDCGVTPDILEVATELKRTASFGGG